MLPLLLLLLLPRPRLRFLRQLDSAASLLFSTCGISSSISFLMRIQVQAPYFSSWPRCATFLIFPGSPSLYYVASWFRCSQCLAGFLVVRSLQLEFFGWVTWGMFVLCVPIGACFSLGFVSWLLSRFGVWGFSVLNLNQEFPICSRCSCVLSPAKIPYALFFSSLYTSKLFGSSLFP